MSRAPVRVLIVDDSALIRQMLTRMMSQDPEIEVVGSAADPYAARDKIKRLLPDVITLDIEMPRMDGLEFLHKIMTLRPMPVVMVSSLTQQGADATLQAMEMGAVDIVAKPTLDLQAGLVEKQDEICTKVKAAASANVRHAHRPAIPRANAGRYISTEKIVAIGASTGGVEALRTVLGALPANSPAILVTQHMPVHFTSTFARRLDSLCDISVEEARDGARILPGHAYIAPGNRHLRLSRSGADYVCTVEGEDRVSGHCPSVDVLFRSVAAAANGNALGVILTGMGKDGAHGLLEMRRAGSLTFGQDAASSLIYGMPRAAMECGAVSIQLPLDLIAQNILDACNPPGKQATRI